MELYQNNLITQEDIRRNHENYIQRLAFYKKRGFDQLQARYNILDHIGNHPKSILEIGTGKGHLTVLLAGRAEKVVTVDINKDDQYIALLNAEYEKVSSKIDFVYANAENLEFPDNSFDLVISAFSFHHFDKPYAIIREMIRITNDYLIITDFHKIGLSIIAQAHRDEGRIHEYNENNDFSITGIFLKENGFSVKEQSDPWQTIFVARKKKDLGG